jgi:hypothetical protein
MSSWLRMMVLVALTSTFLLQLREVWQGYTEPEPVPVRAGFLTEDQEDYLPKPLKPLPTLALGGPLLATDLKLPPDQREVTLAELIAASRSPDAITVREALLGIRRLHDPEGRFRLYEMLESRAKPPVSAVKKQLVWTVGVIAKRDDAPRWQPPLESLLSDPDPAVADYSGFALARLGVPRGAELTRAALLDTKRRPITRGRAALALADGGFRQYATDLQAVLSSRPTCELSNRLARALVVMQAPTKP